MSKIHHAIVGAALIAFLLPQSGQASSTSFPITKIDQSGVVTVTDLKSKQTFQFQVSDPNLLKALKVGQLVYPDFQNQKVSLDGKNLCCTMVNAQQRRLPMEGSRLPAPKTLDPAMPPMQTPGSPLVVPQR